MIDEMSGGLHPIFLAMAVVGIGSGLYALSQHSPWIAPAILGLSLLGLLVRWWMLSRGARSDPARAVDFESLRKLQLPPYAPWIKENLRGHDDVVDQIVARVQQGLDLAGADRTIGAFMLVGPTGTGKTFLAQLIGEALFPKTETVVLRMNQYNRPEDVFTLLGPPPGRPGYDVGGALTQPVLDNPRRVVLLDELDKCHAEVKRCLYNVLDSGQCREKSSGRNVFFNGCVFFATANAGTEALRAVYQGTSDPEVRAGRAQEALAREAGFDRALMARFDGIYLMDRLSAASVAEVACLQLMRQWRRYGIELTYTDPAFVMRALKKNSEFEEYGVRQLSHLIQNMVDPAIDQARRAGAKKVRLGMDGQTGQLIVEVEA